MPRADRTPTRPRWRKLLADAGNERGRLAAMIVAVAVSLAALGTILGGWAVLTREIAVNYLGTAPAEASLELPGGADPALVQRVRELAAVGLAERTTHYPGELSGGEQQRVAIARALAPEPRILIADEPTGNLDQATGKQIADLLFATARERAATLMLVTHDPVLAKRCDRVIAMRSGRVESSARADA